MPVTPSTYQRPDLRIPFAEWDMEGDREKMIATEVFPIFETALQTGNFPRIPKEQLIPKDRDLRRAPRAEYARDTFEFDQDSFATVERGFEEPLDDRERAIYFYAIDAEMYQAERAALRVMRNMEIQLADTLMSTGTFGSGLNAAVGTAWTNTSSCDPVTDVHNAIKAVRSNSGQMANAVIMAWPTFLKLKRCDTVIDQTKHWGGDDPKKITRQMLASLFEVEQLIVAEPQKNTANKGLDGSLSEIWNPDYVLVAKLAKTRDLREVCLGRTMHFSGAGSSPGIAFEQYREDKIKSDIMRAFCDYQQKLLRAECGYLLTGTGVTS